MEWFKTIPFSDVVLWDVKRYSFEKIKSQFPIVKLGMHIQEESHKVKLADYPDEEFGILGVNNKIGIFDAYKEKGANINQSYKKMEKGWLAYNPYRVNVGSIGLRTEEHDNEYISPAYVVFSCKETLLPDFLFKLFKTERFNKVINASTTGSVRQNLTIDILKSLDIPLPPIEVQQKMLELYYTELKFAENAKIEIDLLEDSIKNHIKDKLKLNYINPASMEKGFRTINYKELTRWDFQNTMNLESSFPITNLGHFIKSISTGATPPTKRADYFDGEINFYTPADIGEEKYLFNSERSITQIAIDEKKARVFEHNTLLFVGIGSTIGKVGLVGNEIASSNQQITGLVINSVIANPSFLFYYLHYFKDISTYEKSQATIPILNQDRIANIPIPNVDIETQNRLSSEIDDLRNRINEQKKILDKAIIKANENLQKNVLEL